MKQLETGSRVAQGSGGWPNQKARIKDVLTIDELARYCRIPKSALYKLAQHSRMSGQKIGRQCRFRREAIEGWLKAGGDRSTSSRAQKRQKVKRSR